MSSSNLFDRRGILRGLASLPLVGGGVALIGQPTASAEPLTRQMLESYHSWLNFEERLLAAECGRRFGDPTLLYGIRHDNAGAHFHAGEYGPHHQGHDFASHRAAIVLSAVGCDWRR